MNKYANSWTGNRQFYKGKVKKLPTEETDKDYQAYCKRKKNKNNILSYKAWAKKERRKCGLF